MNLTQTGTEAANPETTPVARGFLLEIGKSVFPVYGDAKSGWSIERNDIVEATPYRYATLDELIFVLVNFSVQTAGTA